MQSFSSEPFLWIHLAGLATLPILLQLCWLGLAVGDPILPVWLEFSIVAAIGVLPILWMQLSRPFLIFAVLGVAQKPTQLDEQQRKVLRLIRTTANRLLAMVAAGLLVGLLWLLYRTAPIAANVIPLPPQWRGLGLLVASVAFLASNLFLQIPVSVARVFVTSETEFSKTKPYPVERIARDFTIVGWQVNRILPQLTNSQTDTAQVTAQVKE
ncbi:low-complexity tail membrane protein [Chroococcidiopsis sp.]|uniref:low-complexity tail membrane protein n=1 Tax=Chroococcidiopsis sp. TaxID=3088168 RepID=UPI003F3D0AAD